jgi:hypothetical protein
MISDRVQVMIALAPVAESVDAADLKSAAP